MAGGTRKRTAYNTNRTVDGNLARKLERELERSGQMAPD